MSSPGVRVHRHVLGTAVLAVEAFWYLPIPKCSLDVLWHVVLQGMVGGAKRSTRSTRRGGDTAEFYELDRDNLARIKVQRCLLMMVASWCRAN
jgi:hypothetical protein